jgi:3-oxoacyl-[acyl-carrier protein] reductase
MSFRGQLSGRRVVVTGSTRGLGLAFAQALGAAGAAVVVNGRDADRCAATVAGLKADGVTAVGVAGSVADPETANRLVETCLRDFGGVDMVINNAGITRDRTLVKMTVEEFDEVIAVHLRGAWALSRAAARAMTETGGTILNVVSGSALFGLVGQSNYAAAKGGMLGLTRALSVELQRWNITVNALYPVAATAMTQPVIDRVGADAMPFGDPADVAPIVVYLASHEAASLTGQVIHFDGRDLVVWSHPDPKARDHRDHPWAPTDISAFFAASPPPLEPLHPDRWGYTSRPHAGVPPAETPGRQKGLR